MRPKQRSAVVLRHVAFEDLGLLAPVLNREGWTVSFCEAAVEDLSHRFIEHADLLIVLGGPIGVYETETYPFLTREIALLERRLAKERPTLGICLGGQLMARALGGRVFAGSVKEIGWGPVALTEAGAVSSLAPLAEDGAKVLHWHGDTFDLPQGATRLASNANYENQAFAYCHHSLALQFHLEADPRQLEEWYVGHAVEIAAARININDLRTATAAIAAGVRAQADRVFGRWLREIAANAEPALTGG
jgi:GMP synthase (glutamine-hydrolysing)